MPKADPRRTVTPRDGGQPFLYSPGLNLGRVYGTEILAFMIMLLLEGRMSIICVLLTPNCEKDVSCTAMQHAESAIETT